MARVSMIGMSGYALRAASLALCCGALLLLVPAGAANAGGDALDAILAALAQRTGGEVKFSEETHSHLLAKPVHSEGLLRYDAPDRLEKRTLAPSAEDLIAQGDVLTLVRGRHHSSLRLSQYPQLSALLEGIRATLAGDRASLEQHFQVSLSTDGAQWELRLTPPAGAGNAGFARVVLRGRADTLQSVSLEQANGDRTLMVLTPVTSG